MPRSVRPARRLRLAALTAVARDVSTPTYRSADLRAGVLHFGVGRFHRAHQASYFDRLAEERVSDGWGIVGAGLRSRSVQRSLAAQDHLFSRCVQTDDGMRLRVVGAMKGMLFAPRERPAVLDALASPDTRLVSLTVTAPTYKVQSTRELAEGVFGLVAEGLRRRRIAGIAPFTVLSCDNVPDNGNAARRQVLAAADLVDGRLRDWIDRDVAFPNSMVDRITPPMTDHLSTKVAVRLGVRDRCAVVTEAFSHWVVEDVFCNERPPLDEVGVQFVADAAPFRRLKTRLLNASHCALGYLGTAQGFRTTAEAMRDPGMRGFVEEMMREEVIPLLCPPSGVDLPAYQQEVVARVSSVALADPLSRLCDRGSVRVPSYVLPSLEDALRHGSSRQRLTLVVAAWISMLRRDDRGVAQDPAAELLRSLVRHHPHDLRPLLRHPAVFGDLGRHEAWVTELSAAVQHLESRGARAAMMHCGGAGGGVVTSAVESTEGAQGAAAS